MSKPVKIVAAIVAVVIVLAIALVVLAKVLITPERIRSTVVPLAEEQLHRPLQLGDIDISLFSGITLHDLAIGEREGEESFVSADRAVLRYRIWPLLLMRVVIDEVSLESPRIRVVRFADGSFNFSDLTGQGGEKGAAAGSSDGSGGAPVDLLVSQVSIVDGELVFLDHTLGTEVPYRYKLSGLKVGARDISLERPFTFDVAGSLGDATFKIDGKADLKEKGGEADIVLSGLDVSAFFPYLQDKVPGTLRSLTVDADLSAEGNASKVNSHGKITLHGVDLVLDAMKEAPLKDASLGLDYRVKADLDAARAEIDKTTVTFNGVPVELSGTVENFLEAPMVDFQVALKSLDLRSALAAAPPQLVAPVKALEPSGNLDARFHLAGSTDKPLELLRDGRIDLKDIRATVAGLRPTLDGGLEIQGDTLASKDLFLVEGDNRADLDLKASNLFGKPIVIKSAISAEKFALDPILAASAAPVVPATEGAEQAKEPGEEVGPLDLPLKADGSVNIGQTLYKGLAIDDFVMSWHLAKNVLTVDKLTGKVAEGSFSETARVNLAVKGLDYSTDLKLEGIHADPFISAFLPKASGTVFGALDLDGKFSGRGTLTETIKRNLSGQGKFLLADGKITGAGLVQGLAGYLDMEELRVLRFSKAAGNFSVDRGKVKIDGDFAGSDVRMAPRGTVGLDGSVDLALNAKLSPDLTSRLGSGGKVTSFLTDKEGWGQLPLKVAGTWNAPRFTLDTAAVREKAKEEIKKKIQEKVLEKLAPKEGKKEGEEEEPAKKLLDETIRGLFGN